MIEFNMKTFGKMTIGVHGKELPKFSVDPKKREWWRVTKGFTIDPEIKMRKEEEYNQKELRLQKSINFITGPKNLRGLKKEKAKTLNNFDSLDTIENLDPFQEKTPIRRETKLTDIDNDYTLMKKQ